MSKRKAGVNDIIYELDNDDIEISSEDEVKEAKMHRLQAPKVCISAEDEAGVLENGAEVINLDSTAEDCDIISPTKAQNGGKTSPDVTVVESTVETNTAPATPNQMEVLDSTKKPSDCPNTTILNEDIVVDSPASNSDLGVVGCENKTPLVTVRFKDKKMAKAYKEKVKAFMLNLIKLHDEENLTGSETESDLELDVWPEDMQDAIEEPMHNIIIDPMPVKEADNLFFVDTAPGGLEYIEKVPMYRQNATLISNIPDKEPSPPPARRGPTCFNCEGAHPLRDCTQPRNNMRINERRKQMVKLGRYHVEDDQKFGHLVPGRISGQLRHALGLKRHELPMFIYKMRQLGYPPGWLEEARISHSGITMFDSTGQAIMDPEEEEGELCAPGSKDKFDIKKILDFPGFNVPPSSRYKDEAHRYGLPPMSEQDSKLAMLQFLAPNAMSAYKRKKLTIFPSASNNTSLQEGHAEMDLDSGDETAEFPSVPPLPDEAPPPAPPPPPTPPPPPPGVEEASDDASADDLEVIEVIKVNDIPVPDDGVSTTDADDEKSQTDSGRESPSIDDLEEKKKRLIEALQSDVTVLNDSVTEPGIEPKTDNNSADDTEASSSDAASTQHRRDVSKIDTPKSSPKVTVGMKTPAGQVRSSELGTPVINIASSFTKLPTDDKFAKDICDVINFENLPNSTGKYQQISSLLKKVKSEVDRIQDS